MTELEAIHFSLLHFYHLDQSNAAIHCADVRFSPITFGLAEVYKKLANKENLLSPPFVHDVLSAKDKYPLDKGR